MEIFQNCVFIICICVFIMVIFFLVMVGSRMVFFGVLFFLCEGGVRVFCVVEGFDFVVLFVLLFGVYCVDVVVDEQDQVGLDCGKVDCFGGIECFVKEEYVQQQLQVWCDVLQDVDQ